MLEITALNTKGDGTAMYEGRLVHVPLSAPGDVVRARIIADRATLEEVIVPSPHRIKPPCGHYGDCGGCSMQHLTAAFQKSWKRERVRAALVSEAIDVCPILASKPMRANSRRRASLSVERKSNGKAGAIGFKARNTHRVVALEQCHILDAELFAVRDLIASLVDTLPPLWQHFTVQITLCEGGFDVNLVSGRAGGGDSGADDFDAHTLARLADLLNGTAIIRLCVNGEPLFYFDQPIVDFDGVRVRFPPGAFLQASAQGERALLAAVRGILANFDLPPGGYIADLFCGCGAFALPLARDYRVHGVDSHGGAVTAMEEAHGARSGVSPLSAEIRDLFRRPLASDELAKFQAVIFDPPRAGAPAQVKQLAQTDIPLIIGVSCNPASFARDARLLAKGGYTLTQIELVDQFAWSPHIELVGRFDKR